MESGCRILSFKRDTAPGILYRKVGTREVRTSQDFFESGRLPDQRIALYAACAPGYLESLPGYQDLCGWKQHYTQPLSYFRDNENSRDSRNFFLRKLYPQAYPAIPSGRESGICRAAGCSRNEKGIFEKRSFRLLLLHWECPVSVRMWEVFRIFLRRTETELYTGAIEAAEMNIITNVMKWNIRKEI